MRTRLIGQVNDAPTAYWLEQLAVGASLERRLDNKLTLQLSAGGIILGRLAADDGSGITHAMRGGGVLGFGVSRNLIEQDGFIPFVMLSGSVATSFVDATTAGLYWALDFRAGVAAGYTFLDRITPYATLRAFGGPIYAAGSFFLTDNYHFQLGAGLVVGIPGGFDLAVECIPLGEQRLSANVGFSF